MNRISKEEVKKRLIIPNIHVIHEEGSRQRHRVVNNWLFCKKAECESKGLTFRLLDIETRKEGNEYISTILYVVE